MAAEIAKMSFIDTIVCISFFVSLALHQRVKNDVQLGCAAASKTHWYRHMAV